MLPWSWMVMNRFTRLITYILIISRELEFYSAYIYSHDESENGRTVSIAEFVEGNIAGWENQEFMSY